MRGQTSQGPMHIADPKTMQMWRIYGRLHGLPTADEMQTMSDQEIYYVYHSYLDNIEVICHRKLRVGHPGDGGWEVCDDYEWRPMEPCIVYSFGINNDFSFDDDIAALYRCRVYAFDPSMGVDSYTRSTNVFFYNFGVGGHTGKLEPEPSSLAKEEGWRMRSFTDLRAMLQHQRTVLDVVKMDIEGSEWIALADMAAKGALSNVRQLLVEFHLLSSDPEIARKRLAALKLIENLGFKRFHTHLNPGCGSLPLTDEYPVRRTRCYEVYFVNSKLMRESKTTDIAH